MTKFLILVALCATASAQVPHYVSNAGSDSNNGLTTGTAWQTVARANTFLAGSPVPGDSVLFQDGGVWHEQLSCLNQVTSASGWTTTSNPPLCSGSSSAQLTIGSYGTGANPIIDAADPITLTCSVFSGATYACTTASAIPSKLYADSATTEAPQMLPVPNAEGAYASGTTYYPYDAVTNAGSQQYVRGPLAPSAGVSFTVLTSWVNIANSVAFNFQQAFSTTNTGVQNVEAIPGSWYADIAGRYGTANTIYLQMSDGSNPSGHTFEGTQRNYCVLLEGVNYVTVQNLTCEHALEGGVVQLTYPLDWGTYFTGEFNQFLNLNVYNFGGIVLNNEPLQGGNNLLQYGILARASMTTNPHGVRGNLISGGRIGTMDTYFGISQKDYQAGAGMQGADGGGATNNIVISNLTVATVNAGGIDYGGTNLNISGTYLINGGRVTGNTTTNNAGGNIFFAGVNCGEVEANLIFNSYGEGLQLGGGGGHTASCEQLIQFNNIYNLSKSPSLGLFNGIDCNSFRSNATGIFIQNNRIFNVGGAAITLENTPAGSSGIGCVSTHVLNNVFSQNGLAWPALTTRNSGSLLFWDTGAGDVSPDFHNNIWIPGSNVTNEFFSTSMVNFTCSTFFNPANPIFDIGSGCTPTNSFGAQVSHGQIASH